MVDDLSGDVGDYWSVPGEVSWCLGHFGQCFEVDVDVDDSSPGGFGHRIPTEQV